MPKWFFNKLDNYYWSGNDELNIIKRIIGRILYRHGSKYDMPWWE